MQPTAVLSRRGAVALAGLCIVSRGWEKWFVSSLHASDGLDGAPRSRQDSSTHCLPAGVSEQSWLHTPMSEWVQVWTCAGVLAFLWWLTPPATPSVSISWLLQHSVIIGKIY